MVLQRVIKVPQLRTIKCWRWAMASLAKERSLPVRSVTAKDIMLSTAHQHMCDNWASLSGSSLKPTTKMNIATYAVEPIVVATITRWPMTRL